jgi:hypothetical protein
LVEPESDSDDSSQAFDDMGIIHMNEYDDLESLYDEEPQPEIKQEPQSQPPPASQSHFAKFKSESFTPDDNASFDSEFARLASSQEWKPGSQEYTRRRTIALCEELHNHYFSQPSVPTINEEPEDFDDDIQEITADEFHRPPPELSDEEATEIRRNGYQALCREVGIDPPPFHIGECKSRLKQTLVNIVDLVDAQRTGKKAKVWDSFEAFRAYTLLPEHRIAKEEVKGTELASLLQNLSRRGRGADWRSRGRRVGVIGGGLGRVKAGKVVKCY